jgi:hypothetical protein
MPEAGWLLLLLFLGVCSLIVVAILYPSFRRATYPATGETEPLKEEAPTEPPQAPAIVLPLTAPSLSLTEWLSMVNDHPDDAPHTLIIGTSGTGKTTIAQAIAATRSGYLVILDPKWQPGRWGGLPAIPIDDDGKYTQIEAAIKALLGELNTRLVSLKSGASDFPELTIIAEELPTLISECPSAATLFKQVGRLGRELRIRVVGLSQSDRVKSLGVSGEGDAIDNYTMIRLGKTAVALVPDAHSLTRPAVLAWQGKNYLMLLDGVVRLATQPIPQSRLWALETPAVEAPKQPSEQESEQTPELTLSVPEIAQVVHLITSGVERGKAIRAMPRYSRKLHREYAAFYDEFKQAMKSAHE